MTELVPTSRTANRVGPQPSNVLRPRATQMLRRPSSPSRRIVSVTRAGSGDSTATVRMDLPSTLTSVSSTMQPSRTDRCRLLWVSTTRRSSREPTSSSRNPRRLRSEGVVAGNGTPRAAKAAARACSSSGKPAFIVGTHSCRPAPFTRCRTLVSRRPSRTLTEASPCIDRTYVSSLSTLAAVPSVARASSASSKFAERAPLPPRHHRRRGRVDRLVA